MYVWDTELTVPSGRSYLHAKTKKKPRLSDGLRHPVRVIKEAKPIGSLTQPITRQSNNIAGNRCSGLG